MDPMGYEMGLYRNDSKRGIAAVDSLFEGEHRDEQMGWNGVPNPDTTPMMDEQWNMFWHASTNMFEVIKWY